MYNEILSFYNLFIKNNYPNIYKIKNKKFYGKKKKIFLLTVQKIKFKKRDKTNGEISCKDYLTKYTYNRNELNIFKLRIN